MNYNRLLFTSTLLILFLSSCHLARSIFFLRPDHKDGKKMPYKEVSGASEIYQWAYHSTQLDKSQIKVELEDSSQMRLDSFLTNTATNAFLIIKDGKILSENYYRNYDEDRKHTSFSVSKAMLASCLGIALQDGFIQDLSEPITTYIPELLDNDSAFSHITIEHLFDMKSGIKIRGKDASLLGDLAKTYYGTDWFRFMKTIEIDTLPGGVYSYNQTDAQLLSLIIARATKQELSTFVDENIWKKIGSNTAFWNVYDRNNLEKGFCCFNARVQDFAKFGQLYLQNGNWNGEQIIPKDWIAYTTQRNQIIESEWEFSFHKYWFLANDGESDYCAQGYNRQFIYINPNKNVVILRFGRKENEKNVDWEFVLRNLARQL